MATMEITWYKNKIEGIKSWKISGDRCIINLQLNWFGNETSLKNLLVYQNILQ